MVVEQEGGCSGLWGLGSCPPVLPCHTTFYIVHSTPVSLLPSLKACCSIRSTSFPPVLSAACITLHTWYYLSVINMNFVENLG